MPVVRFLQWLALAAFATLALGSVPANAQTVGSPIPAGSNPRAIAVDPIANKVYIASEFTNAVIALDGATNTTTSIAVGTRPQYIAVNPTNHKVYASNGTDASLTVIDGTTNTVDTTIAGIGSGPIAIDPLTNRIFMVRLSTTATDEVAIVDGNTNTFFAIAIDSFQPDAIAINPVTNKVYVATYGTGDVRIVDGNTNVDFPHPPSVPVFSHPTALAVNPVTNRTYVVTEDSRGPFGYIDGNANYTFFTAPGHAAAPKAVAVNPVTNMIYAAFDGEILVMNGATDAFTFIPSGTAGAGPIAVGVNPSTNKIYVPNADGTLTVIDGATNAVTTLTIPTGATAIGVNPVTNRMYVTAPDSVSVVAGAATDTAQAIPLTTTITHLAGDTSDPNPTFALDASSGFLPVAPPVWRVYFQLDGTTGPWTAASGSGPYSARFSGLSSGAHTLYAFASDTQEGPTVNAGTQSVPLVGSITSYAFTVAARIDPSTSLTSQPQGGNVGQSVTFTLVVSGNSGTPTGTATFAADGTAISGCSGVALSAGKATCTTSSLTTGHHTISAAYSGDATYNPATASMTQAVYEDPTINISSSKNPSVFGDTVTFTATIGGSAGPATSTASFRSDGGIISGCDNLILSNGTITCSTSGLAVGTHAITVRYEGDTNYNLKTSAPFSQTVTDANGKTNPTVSLASNPNPSVPAQTVVLTATVSGGLGTPTGSVTFLDGSSQLCTQSLASGSAECSTTFTKGTHNLTASYSGDAAYNGATSPIDMQTVGALANASWASSVNPSSEGQSVTFTLTLTGAYGTPTGTATFLSDSAAIAGCTNVALANGVAACTTASLAPGQHNIEILYSGDPTYVGFETSPLVQTVSGPASITSPPNGSTLGGSSQLFQWGNSGASLYQLWVGSTQGAYDIGYFPQSGTTGTSVTATGLPTDGRTLYVRLYSAVNGAWQFRDFTYTAAGSGGFTPSPASIANPAPGATLTSSSQLFQWNNSGASLYQLWVGSTQGAYDVGYFPQSGTTGTSVTATGLPTDGRTLYVRLYSAINGAWQFRDFTYTAAGSGGFTPTPASITSPTPGATLTASSQLFQWDNSGASLYQLWVGSTQGDYDIGYFPQSGTTGTSVTATGLPTDGRTLYVRLYSAINGAWQFRDFTYTAAGSGGFTPTPASITSPAPGATLPGSSATFNWNAASGASLYQIWVGTTPGGYDIGYFPQTGTTATSVTATGLPTDGRALYVRLYTAIGSTWYFNDSTYKAAGP